LHCGLSHRLAGANAALLSQWPRYGGACSCLPITDKRVLTKLARVTEADLHSLCKQICEKSLEACIDTTYKLKEVVEAHRYIDTDHKKGHVAFVFDTAAEQQKKDQ